MRPADLAYTGPSKPVVGILGGMGPSATADFMAKLVARTPVSSESDHLPVALWSNPEIPDRTRALIGRGPSPVPAMADGVRRLLDLGATTIAIPCNTAHAFIDDLRARTHAHFLNMIEAAVAAARSEHPDMRAVGILSTAGTRRTGLYTAACRRAGLIPIELPEIDQARLVNPSISEVKTGADRRAALARIHDATAVLAQLGASAVIAGCTEIPLITGKAAEVLPIVDATDCLARAVITHVRHAGSREKLSAWERSNR
ncbi:MAG TPA: amino acid racemase [Pseudonocardiaceae bacterium]|nr:amino acid racemase [Pseudonocardiaceae bacterium]